MSQRKKSDIVDITDRGGFSDYRPTHLRGGVQRLALYQPAVLAERIVAKMRAQCPPMSSPALAAELGLSTQGANRLRSGRRVDVETYLRAIKWLRQDDGITIPEPPKETKGRLG